MEKKKNKKTMKSLAFAIVLLIMFRGCYSGKHSHDTTNYNNANDTSIAITDNDYLNASSSTPDYDYSYSINTNNSSHRLIDLIDRPANNETNNESDYSNENSTSHEATTDVYSQINNAVENMLPSVTVYAAEDWSWIDFQSLEYGAANLLEYTYRHNSDGSTTYYFTYNVSSLDEYNSRKNEINCIAQEATASIYPSMSCVEKSRIIHDYLITHTVYDYTFSNPNSHNIYGVLHDHVGICSGYSAAFKFLMNYVGEEAAIVSSGTHSWNQVSSNPNVYIDCTWDNQDYAFNGNQEFISYDHFALNDTDLYGISDHLIIDRSQEVGSHPEYTWNDSIATTVFSYYDISSITQYCIDAYYSGYMNMTLDFDNYEAYNTALANLPNELYEIAQSLNVQETLYYSHNDGLMNIQIYIGEWYSLVDGR